MNRKIKIILMLMFSFCTAFGSTQIGMSIHDSTFVNGSTVDIPVYVDSSLTGLNVTSYKLQLTFNQYLLKVDSVITAGTLSQTWGSAAYNNNNPGRIDIAAAGSSALIGTGILLYLRVTPIGSGYMYFSFTDTLNNYFNEGSPKMSFKNGYMNIQAMPSISIYPTSGLITAGETLQFNAYSGKVPYTWTVTDPSVAKIDSNGLLTATGMGFTKVVAKDSNGVVDTTTGNIEVRPFKLSFRDSSFYQGQTVMIPVYSSNLNGLNVLSGQFTLSFNGNILTPISIITTGTLTQSFANPTFSYPSSGQMNISFAGSSSISGSGILFYINFQITSVNSGGTSLTLSNILFNQNLPGNYSPGNFNVINLATLYISPSTSSLITGDTLRFSASGGTAPYRWFVSDSTLASIDSTGLLRAIKGGVVIVSAKDVYGGKGNSGNINLYDTKLSALDTTAVSGSTVDLPISIGSLSPSFTISSLQTTVTFDSSLVKFDQIISTGTLTNGWAYQINNQGNKIVLAAAGSGSFNSAGVVFKIQFIVSTNAQVNNYTSVSLQQFLFNEGSPLPEIKNGSITIASVLLPAAPGSLNASAGSSSVINLTWNDNSNNETGFKVERSIDSLSGYSLIQTLPANTTAYSDTGLTDGTKFYYMVYAYNSGGNSNYSNVASAITALNAPSNLSGTDSLKVKLTWTDNSSSELGFIIERKQGAAGIYSAIDSVGTNVTTYVDSNVTVGMDYVYRVKAYNNYIQSGYSNEFSITITKISVWLNNIPDKFDLLQNYPNPFNPSTIIKYDIPKTAFVSLKIFNLLGKEIATLVNEEKLPGEYSITFNADNLPGSGRNLSSGIYFYKIYAGSFSETKKFILLK